MIQPCPSLRFVARVGPDIVPKVWQVSLFVDVGSRVLFVGRFERGKIGTVRVVLTRQRVLVFGPYLGAVGAGRPTSSA